MRKLMRAVKVCLKPLYHLLPSKLRTVVHHIVHRLISALAAPTIRVSVAKLEAHVEVLRGCMVENERMMLALLHGPPAVGGGWGGNSPPGTQAPAFAPIPLGDRRLLVPHPVASFMYLDTKDLTALPRLLPGAGEPELVAVLGALVHPGDVVVEANAQQGYHTLTLARRAGPAGRVIAFEPDPLCLAVLRDNVAAHKLHSVVAIVSEGRISDHLRQSGLVPDVVRLDAGGAESAVLEDLGPFLRARPDARVVLSLHASPELAGVLERLGGMGLRFWQVLAGELRPTPAEHLLDAPAAGRIDLVAARSENW
jgi:precorrin-6B methylase 2